MGALLQPKGQRRPESANLEQVPAVALSAEGGPTRNTPVTAGSSEERYPLDSIDPDLKDPPPSIEPPLVRSSQKVTYPPRRYGASCDRCRERKAKCDFGFTKGPNCSECSKRDSQCEFTQETDRLRASKKRMALSPLLDDDVVPKHRPVTGYQDQGCRTQATEENTKVTLQDAGTDTNAKKIDSRPWSSGESSRTSEASPPPPPPLERLKAGTRRPSTGEAVNHLFGPGLPGPSLASEDGPRKADPLGPDDIARVNDEVGSSSDFRQGDGFLSSLNRSYSAATGDCNVEILVNWELEQFCETELGRFSQRELVEDMPRILTVTSPGMTCTATQAASCEEYTRLVWGSTGEEILRFVLSNARQKEACQFLTTGLWLRVVFKGPIDLVSQLPTAVLDVRGRPRIVADVLEQFAWMATTFRPLSSQTPFSRSAGIILRGVSRNTIRLDPLTTTHSDPFCWTSILSSAVVATGFPIRRRFCKDQHILGKGIEIPFDVMASLARVSAMTEFEGRQLLIGPSMVLYPTEILSWPNTTNSTALPAAIQWHCIKSDSLSSLDTGLIPEAPTNDSGTKMDIVDLVSLRCFLGYFEKATVHLGTEAPAEREVVSLGLPKSGQRVQFAREGTFTLGFNVPGIVNGSIAGKVLLTQSLRMALGETKEYEDLLTDSKRQPLVLYDVGSQTGWLVSELSIVLFLCLTFLSLPSTQARFRGSVPDLPLATPTGDGGTAAEQYIFANGDLELWKKALGGDSKTFHSLVHDFLRDVRTLRNTSLLHQIPPKTSVFPVLRGLEFADIVARKDMVDEKKLGGNMIPPWWPLCSERRVYAIFHTGLGQVIRPASYVQSGWEAVLGGASLLVASMPCVRQLNNNARHPKQQACSCYHITDNVVWDPQFCSRCCDCEVYTKDMIQRLRQLSVYNGAQCPGPRRLPSETGAIIFGDHTLFHNAVKRLEMEPRRLERGLTGLGRNGFCS